MKKKEIMKYYLEEWIPYIDNYSCYHSKKGKIINYNGSKILINVYDSLFYWTLHLIPKSKNNILTNDFNLLFWSRTEENYIDMNSDNPIGLKEIMNKKLFSKKITWQDVYNFLDYIKSNCEYKPYKQ